MMQQAALQCSTGQYLFDINIPMYLGDLNEDFDEQHLWAVLVQVKNSKKAHKLDLKSYKNDYRKYFQSGTAGFHRPLLSILLNSGAEEPYFELADFSITQSLGSPLAGGMQKPTGCFKQTRSSERHVIVCCSYSQRIPKTTCTHAHTFEGRFLPISNNIEGLDSSHDGKPPQKNQMVRRHRKGDVI